MSEARFIGLFGVSQTDLSIYLAYVIQNMSHTVALCDNSYEGAMAYCVPKPEGDISTVNYKNIDYYRLVGKPREQITGYDYVVSDYGVWPDPAQIKGCDELFLVIDPSAALLKRYREYLQRLALPADVVLRGYLPDMVPYRRIRHLLEQENPFVRSFGLLALSEEDEVNRLVMQYEYYKGFAGASKGMERLMLGMAKKVTGAEDGMILNAYRRAKRGECA